MIKFKLKQQIAELEFREKRRVALQEVADATNINRATLSKMLNQHGAVVRSDVLDKLCDYFECRLEDLAEHIPSED